MNRRSRKCCGGMVSVPKAAGKNAKAPTALVAMWAVRLQSPQTTAEPRRFDVEGSGADGIRVSSGSKNGTWATGPSPLRMTEMDRGLCSPSLAAKTKPRRGWGSLASCLGWGLARFGPTAGMHAQGHSVIRITFPVQQ